MYDGATSVPGIPHGAIDPSSQFPHAVEEGDDEVLEAENCDADEEVEEDAVDKVASGDAEKMMLSVKKKEDIDLVSNRKTDSPGEKNMYLKN